MREIEKAMVWAIKDVLNGDRMKWRKRNTEVYNDLARGCEAVVTLYDNEIARIKRNAATGRHHGWVTTLWPTNTTRSRLRALMYEFGTPMPPVPSKYPEDIPDKLTF